MPENKVEPPPKGQPLKIFCIESWSSDLRSKSTVRPLLELLETEAGIGFIHQRVVTVEELKTNLGYWTRYSTYRVGFLALHGAPGHVEIGGAPVSVDELIDLTTGEDEWALNLRGKIVYFGTCLTMDDKDAIDDFRHRTGARLVCGYTKSVDWLESAAFELLLLSRFAANADPVRALGPLYKHHRGLLERLGFTAVPAPT